LRRISVTNGFAHGPGGEPPDYENKPAKRKVGRTPKKRAARRKMAKKKAKKKR
jgi:hypothetical protein